MTQIKIDTPNRTVTVDEEMTPAELEVFLLEKAVEEGWVSVTFEEDKDPLVVVQGGQIPLNK